MVIQKYDHNLVEVLPLAYQFITDNFKSSCLQFSNYNIYARACVALT